MQQPTYVSHNNLFATEHLHEYGSKFLAKCAINEKIHAGVDGYE